MILLDKNPSVRTTIMAVRDLREAGARGRGFITRGSGSDMRESEKVAPDFLPDCVRVQVCDVEQGQRRRECSVRTLRTWVTLHTVE